MKMKKIISLLSALSFFAMLQTGLAQQHDYPAYPKTDIVFEQLEANLDINEQMQVSGEVNYSVRFNIGVSDSLQLNAERMQVSDVLVNGRTMDFSFNDGKLTIFLMDEFNRNDNATIGITYSTEPVFGFLKNYGGTMFTSQLPLSTSHWLPVIDHPGITVATDITVSHPSSKKLVMTGRRAANSVVSVEKEETRYVSRYPVPVTSLFLAIGDFQSESRSHNSIEYHIHSEQPNGDHFDANELIEVAGESISKMEELTGVEYPHSSLHIVILDDLMWESRMFGAGAILVDANYSAEDQVKYGIAGQWAGVMLREMQWSGPEALQLLMGYFANELDIDPIEMESMQDWDSLTRQHRWII